MLGWAQQGKRVRKKHRACLSKVRHHEGAVVSHGGEGERGPGRGDVSTKSGGGKACPGETNTKALWFSPPKSQLKLCWSAIKKQKTKTQYVVFDAFRGVNTPTWPLSSYQCEVMVRWVESR